jgi:hypothetical protein
MPVVLAGKYDCIDGVSTPVEGWEYNPELAGVLDLSLDDDLADIRLHLITHMAGPPIDCCGQAQSDLTPEQTEQLAGELVDVFVQTLVPGDLEMPAWYRAAEEILLAQERKLKKKRKAVDVPELPDNGAYVFDVNNPNPASLMRNVMHAFQVANSVHNHGDVVINHMR